MSRREPEDGPHRLDVAIGQRMRERRRSLGLSQMDLAEALGVSFQQVQKYERGANRISFSRLVGVAGALRCRVSDLAEGLEPDHRPEAVDHVNQLMRADGALEMLEAYVALPDPELRAVVRRHIRELVRAVAAKDVSGAR